jgi:hypothetical protein
VTFQKKKNLINAKQPVSLKWQVTPYAYSLVYFKWFWNVLSSSLIVTHSFYIREIYQLLLNLTICSIFAWHRVYQNLCILEPCKIKSWFQHTCVSISTEPHKARMACIGLYEYSCFLFLSFIIFSLESFKLLIKPNFQFCLVSFFFL